MCKKLIYGMLTSAALLATSCIYDGLDAPAPEDQSQVTFNLDLEGALATRGISDGESVNKLFYSIYKVEESENGDEVVELQKFVGADELGRGVKDDFVSGTTVTVNLAKEQTYRAVFWAQNAECTAYDAEDLTNVKVSYASAANNDENRDAFCAVTEFVAGAGVTCDVVLRRPFAQVNVGVVQSDWDQAVASGVTVKESSVVIKNAATSLNLLTGEVGPETEDVEVSYTAAAIPSETLYVETDETVEGKEAYVWLSMSYILVADHNDVAGENGMLGDESATLESAEFTFVPENGTNILLSDGLTNIPVQRNWRTNILGHILTGDVNFTITVDPNYCNDVNLMDDVVYASSVEDLMKWAYAVNKGDKTLGLNLTADIVIPAYTIEEDPDNKTYVFTDTPITVENGVPSGSNWVPVCPLISSLGDGYNGMVSGRNHTISGLCVKGDGRTAGFIGLIYDGASVKDLILDKAFVYGNGADGESGTAAVVGRSQHNTLIENVKVTNSHVSGVSNVGGIAGRNYCRKSKGEELAFVRNCAVDANSSIVGKDNVGGICGQNYGAVLINCVTGADVTGSNNVGGVVGQSRDYYIRCDGYVIACGTTADATITSTGNYAGGIVGYTVKDNNHVGTVSYIVACYSNAVVTANKPATMVGFSNNGSIIASWSLKNGVDRYANFSTGNTFPRTASEHFDNADEITAEFVAEMNAAIDAYNSTEGIEVTCPFKWSWSEGNWPVLL